MNEPIDQAESETRPGVFYDIQRDTSSIPAGKIWCDCPRWNKKARRNGWGMDPVYMCKHIEQRLPTIRLEWVVETLSDGHTYLRSRIGAARATTPAPLSRGAAPVSPVRTARPTQAYVPSLEQVRRATPARPSDADVVRRGSRRRPDDE